MSAVEISKKQNIASSTASGSVVRSRQIVEEQGVGPCKGGHLIIRVSEDVPYWFSG
jgi:hypothetical protein